MVVMDLAVDPMIFTVRVMIPRLEQMTQQVWGASGQPMTTIFPYSTGSGSRALRITAC
jgi:hypothetical protein